MRASSCAVLLAALLVVAGCDAGGANEDERIVEGVDLDALFAPPTDAERASVLADWSARTVRVAGVEEIDETTVDAAGTTLRARVVAHTVDGNRHYGLILAPVGAADGSLPVLVYGHGGDAGTSLEEVAGLLAFGITGAPDAFVIVAPSFRDEAIRMDNVTYRSGGDPSPWDRDVDDALALLDVALATTPAADPNSIAAFGFSRGAGTALLMAIRDPRIAGVVDYFGPTDFFGEYVQEITEEALLGRPRDLPGLDYLNETLVLPLREGAITIAAVRLALLRRSPVYFAERLPEVLAHHGLADTVVAPSQTRALTAAMNALGRTPPAYEAFLYPGMGHFPDLATFSRTAAFLQRTTQGAASVSGTPKPLSPERVFR